ncbi:ABC transporter ATP-binding protein [Phytohabitans rumicis]|uniref:Macrolide ABC transporter ATP-binding protein n=1 Tax=Phytohabitans rumicis TaxID=1076125 RepID=A0A6V8LAV0_9ACTN|nr:ABC transporter ATP-binding protein [Phytohabitans rumicis]GFJ91206.1 macrolide ABC transporter ATP-binding protein [Phytohabitans rumicis]
MTTATISFDGVGRTYPGRPPVQALHPGDLTITSGQYVAVVGPSGSGKSTFLNVVGLLDTPTAGRYLLDDIDVAQLNERQRGALRGRRIGFVFQAFHLLPHRSAVENVALAMLYNAVPPAQRRERATEALLRVGLGPRLHAAPTTMSGGERQRVAVARAVVNKPSLLLCDEPTGNLDSRTAESVLDVFDELHRAGMTIIVVTHNDQVAERAERVVTIRDGVLDAGPEPSC